MLEYDSYYSYQWLTWKYARVFFLEAHERETRLIQKRLVQASFILRRDDENRLPSRARCIGSRARDRRPERSRLRPLTLHGEGKRP